MWFKGVDFFPHSARFQIIKWRHFFIGVSWALAILSAVLLYTRGLNYGVDFKGGSLIEVQAKAGALDVAKLRDKLTALHLGDVQVQGVGTTGAEALIRIAEQPDEKAQAVAAKKVAEAIGDMANIRRTETVGPAVSAELKWTGIKAVVFALLGILAYVWFRFEWQFAVAGILALVHDVFITTGMFSLLWYEFDLATVAALLTLAGYSINDTVVVFDRIRENLRRYKKMPIEELLNLSINETLSRTVLTSSVTAVSVLALYLFGTAAIHGFSFAMLFGILIGTYSSIFVAAALLITFGVKRDWSGEDPEKAAGKPKPGQRGMPTVR
jgi:preprotein translocase SecF subunit